MEMIKLNEPSTEHPLLTKIKGVSAYHCVIFSGIFWALITIYANEMRKDRNAADNAYLQQKAKNKGDTDAAWMSGFMAGANCSLDTMARANAQISTLTTNAPEFVRSNLIWAFNLQRPK